MPVVPHESHPHITVFSSRPYVSQPKRTGPLLGQEGLPDNTKVVTGWWRGTTPWKGRRLPPFLRTSSLRHRGVPSVGCGRPPVDGLCGSGLDRLLHAPGDDEQPDHPDNGGEAADIVCDSIGYGEALGTDHPALHDGGEAVQSHYVANRPGDSRRP